MSEARCLKEPAFEGWLVVLVVLVAALFLCLILEVEHLYLYRFLQAALQDHLYLFLAQLQVVHLFLLQTHLIHLFQSGMLRYRVL